MKKEGQEKKEAEESVLTFLKAHGYDTNRKIDIKGYQMPADAKIRMFRVTN